MRVLLMPRETVPGSNFDEIQDEMPFGTFRLRHIFTKDPVFTANVRTVMNRSFMHVEIP